MHAGCVVSGESGAKAVVVEGRASCMERRKEPRKEMQMQIEKMRTKTIGNAFLRHNTPLVPDFANLGDIA